MSAEERQMGPDLASKINVFELLTDELWANRLPAGFCRLRI
jgi:hypothetical protein